MGRGGVAPGGDRGPTLDSQIRFWGAVWSGSGAALWWASARLRSAPGLFRLLLGILVLAGLGRAASVARYGWPGAPLTAALAVELVGPAALWAWHGARLREATARARCTLGRR